MTPETIVKFYLLGNEDAKAFADKGIYQLADKRGISRDTAEWNAFVAGGAAYRFNGHTFKTSSQDIPDPASTRIKLEGRIGGWQ